MNQRSRLHYLPAGSHPQAEFHSPDLRRAARSFSIFLIPLGLALILVITSSRTWLILRNGILNWSQSSIVSVSGISSENILASETNDDDPSDSIRISPGLTPQVLRWSSDILIWSDEFKLDPNLVAVVMQIESCGYPSARSPSGAMGLFQVMPFHFSSDQDPYDPLTNATRGLSYLSKSLELAQGRIDLALAGYNGGHSVIRLNPSDWPIETQRYVRWGVGIIQDIELGKGKLNTLQAWLEAGGIHLCMLAENAQDRVLD